MLHPSLAWGTAPPQYTIFCLLWDSQVEQVGDGDGDDGEAEGEEEGEDEEEDEVILSEVISS